MGLVFSPRTNLLIVQSGQKMVGEMNAFLKREREKKKKMRRKEHYKRLEKGRETSKARKSHM